MPQLMPLNWCVSFLVVGFLLMMMVLVYFKCGENCDSFDLEGNKNELIWKW